MPQIAAGLRNNNPLNIMHNPKNKWVGLATPPADSANRCRFITMEHGIRAAAVLLMAHQDRFGADSVFDHIAGIPNAKGKYEHGWAPAGVDNNETAKYIDFVAKRLGVGKHDPIDVSDYRIAKPMIKAMCQFENGSMPLTDAVIDRGLTMAGIKPFELEMSATAKAGKLVGVGSLGAVSGGGVADALAQASDTLQPLAHLSKWIGIACAVLAIAGVSWMLYVDWDRRRRGH